MSVFGIALVKDEEDVIERTVRHMAGQVDELIVADNMSSDATREILDELACDLPLEVLEDRELAHYQGRKLTDLAHLARERGATWVIPFDADELHYAVGHDRIADVLTSDPDAWIYTSQLYEHPFTDELLGIRGHRGHAFERMGYRWREPSPLLKIAARTDRRLVITEGSHSCNFAGTYPKTIGGQIEIRHFPYRSVEQFIRKARNGSVGRNATDLGPEVGGHLREWGRILEEGGEDALAAYFVENLVRVNPDARDDLVWDPAP